MEWSGILILENFDLILHIMPYYARTHKAFLLLSSLWSTSRLKLDESYDEFIHYMRSNWLEINWDFNLNYLALPFDLFMVKMWDVYETNFEVFTEFIEGLKMNRGCYFNSHSMNSLIKIKSFICVQLSLIKRLNTYVDILKSIQVSLSHNLSLPISLNTIWKILIM